MSEDYEDIPMEEGQDNSEQEEQELEATAAATGKFDRLLGEDSRKFKLSGMFKEW